MRTIARHFLFSIHVLRNMSWIKTLLGISPAQLEKMAKWRKQELLNANISPSMTVYDIARIVNTLSRSFLHFGLKNCIINLGLGLKKCKLTIGIAPKNCKYDKFHPATSIRLSLLNYKEQDWMVNIPLYAVCNM